jgi:hypothetical protein
MRYATHSKQDSGNTKNNLFFSTLSHCNLPFSLRPVRAIGIGEIRVWELFHDTPIGLRPRLLAEVVAVRIGGTRLTLSRIVVRRYQPRCRP